VEELSRLEQPKKDPRVLRTRQLIQDAFLTLIQHKDIQEITVRDITEKATINRATFYAHFSDKYELLDETLSSMLKDTLRQKLQCHELFSEDTMVKIIVIMCEFQTYFNSQCPKTSQTSLPYAEERIKEELQKFLLTLIQKSPAYDDMNGDPELAYTVSVMMSWSIYGVSVAWNKGGRSISTQEMACRAQRAMLRVLQEFTHNESARLVSIAT
jgi:AcrR family transcriptional regulator